MNLTQWLLHPFMETPGDGGGGGSAGGGGDLGSGGLGGDGGGAPTPQHIEISADSYIKAPGSDKPVKYSDYINGFVPKADFTRAQQKAAAEIQQRERALQDQEARFRSSASQIWQKLQGGQPGQGAPANSFDSALAQLETSPYVDGKTAAGLMRTMLDQNVKPLQDALAQRDNLLGLAFKKLQALDGTVGTLRNRTSAGDFNAKMATVRSSLGLPDDPIVSELLQDVYLSHEGNDLDREFPNMVKTRMDGLRQIFRAMDKKDADDAKTRRMGLPGRGGAASAGRPLKRGYQSPAQIAEMFWPGGASDT